MRVFLFVQLIIGLYIIVFMQKGTPDFIIAITLGAHIMFAIATIHQNLYVQTLTRELLLETNK